MKKLLTISLILLFISFSAMAQQGRENYRRHAIREGIRSGQLTRPELRELYKDELRYNQYRRRAQFDGFVSPYERLRLHKMKVHNRREAFWFRHNRHRRLI